MKTEYRALLYRYEVHLTLLTDKAHILSKVNDELYGDHIGERVLGTYETVADAIARAKQPDVSPTLFDAPAFGKLLVWQTTEVIKIAIDDDGDEDWDDEALVIQYPTPEELVAYVLECAREDEEEEEE